MYETWKKQCHKIFFFRFFHESSSPKPLKIILGSFKIFLQIRRDIHKSRCTTGVNYTCGKFASGINNTGGKFCQRDRWYCWYWWQIMGIIPDCWHLKVSFIYMLILLPKGVKKLKLFNLRFFPICRWCQRHQRRVLSCEYLREFLEIWNGPNGILRGLEETDSWKNLKQNIS